MEDEKMDYSYLTVRDLKVVCKFFKIDIQTGKVIKNEAGKVMKPEGWTPPKLDNFIKP
jgi:hypothetical protein